MFKKFLICILLLCINLVGCLESKAVNSNNVEESYKSKKVIELYVPDDNISKCIITKEAVDGTAKPVIEYRTENVSLEG